MDLGLTDRTVVVTGASKGIGLACARAFAAEGARVAIVSRSRANLDAALAALPRAKHGMIAIVADLVSIHEAKRAVD
jgi:NAD(P)-dependent dehydrogenase (short-subunit alcohol dehydrogenase family)